jgi:hypothetical protein
MDLAVKFADGSDIVVEGLAIPYGGTVKGRDLHGQTFTRDTNLALDWFPDEGRPGLFDHGLVAKAAQPTTGPGISVVARQTEREETDLGQWVKVQLDRRSKYLTAIQELVQGKALAFSSGAHPLHVQVDRAGVIKQWPWIELSLTPTPAEPGLTEVYAVKTADALDHLTSVRAVDALKSLYPNDEDDLTSGPEAFDDHAERVASEVSKFVERAVKRYETRTAQKAGRELSAANREWLRKLGEDIAALLARTDPAGTSKAIAELEAELLISEMRRAGLDI